MKYLFTFLLWLIFSVAITPCLQAQPCTPSFIVEQPASGSAVCPSSAVFFRTRVNVTKQYTYDIYFEGQKIATTSGASNTVRVDLNPASLYRAGNYYIVITSDCNSLTTTNFNLSFTGPSKYNVTGGGTYCAGGDGVPVGLANSQSGVSYQLQRDGTAQGNPVPGMGDALNFGNQTAGTYTVLATNTSTNCQQTMTGSAVVTAIQSPTATLTNDGPITCTKTTVTLTAGGGGTYVFSNGATQQGGGNTATVTAEGTYTVTVTSNGCSSFTTTTVTSNTTAAQNVTLSNSGTLTCAQTSVKLTSGSSTTGVTYSITGPSVTASSSNTATVNQQGLYTVKVTGANGCTATQTTNVESNTTAPTATLTNNGPISDNNQTVTLTAGGGTTYAFSPGATSGGGNTATVTTPGIYSVTATRSDNGCTAIASTTLTGAKSQTTCRNGTAIVTVLAAGNPAKYEWYRNSPSSARLTELPNFQRGTNTASLTLINQQTSASYYVKVTDQNGTVVVYGPFRVTVDLSCNAQGRVAAQEVALRVTLLGNPLQGESLRATVSGAAGKALNVQLLDLSGRAIRVQTWQQVESEQPVEWSLTGQASGVYLLQATTDGDAVTPAQKHSLKVIKP